MGIGGSPEGIRPVEHLCAGQAPEPPLPQGIQGCERAVGVPVIGKDEAGKVYVPWDGIGVRMALGKQAA